jgi:hypothetical protein
MSPSYGLVAYALTVYAVNKWGQAPIIQPNRRSTSVRGRR